MSNYTVEVIENINILDVVDSNTITLEITSSDNFITFNTPSGYPISATSGILDANRVGSGYLTSNLANFNSSVSGLLPSISGSGYVISSLNNNVYTISVSGLQPTGNYSTVGHSHLVSHITNFSSGVNNVVSGIYAPINNPTFTGTVSGITKSMVGLSNVDNTSDINKPVSTAQALANSGVQSAAASDATTKANNAQSFAIQRSNHTGTQLSSTISNFNSSVSGLLPVINITAGNNISISNNSGNFTINSTATGGGATISNSGVNRLLINDGSTSGIVGQSNLTFNGSLLNVSGSGLFSNNVISSGFIRTGGTSSQFLKADGSIDTNSYGLTSGKLNQFASTSSAELLGIINDETGSGLLVFNNSPTLIGVPLVPTATSGTNTQQIASTAFVRTEISNLINSAPSTLDTLNELANALSGDPNFATTVTNNLATKANLSGAIFTGSISGPSGDFTNLRQNGTIVSVSGHTHTINDVGGLQTALDNKQPSGSYAPLNHNHTASNITDFNSSVSGLLPVKNILAGYDINITNNSGVYTVASTNLVHVDSQQPQGFVNRTDSRISVSGNVFRIEPTGSSYSYYNKGVKVIKTSGDSLTIPNLTQINYIHFDTINNQISNKTTSFDFSTDIPIAYIAWNSGVGPSGQMTFFAEERHGIVMDTSTHKWIHYTFGAQYVEGLSISNYSTSGNGSSNSDATIAIGNGLLYQEDIEINITDSSSADPFCQELSPIAQIPVYYHEGSTGQWVKNAATNYPVKYGANGPQYNLLTGGTWSTPDVSPGGATRYFAVWILATNQIDDPIISIMGQRVDSNPGSAESNNSWSDVNLTNLPLSEVKPLYRLIFAGDSDFTNTPKCYLYSILDIRVSVISTVAGVSQNDHGSLFGLGDDDHSQYLHVDNARTVNATHTFANGLTSNGLISSTSGNFTSLNANNLNVSSSGDINILKINKLYHQNLAVATGIANNDLMVAIIDPSGTATTQVIQGSVLRSSLLNQSAQLQFRQGTNLERLLITPASGEPIWVTDTQKFYIGDGTTVGGDFIGPSLHDRGSGVGSIVALNSGCIASGTYSTVIGGLNNNTTSDYSVVGGGKDNTSAGNYSTIGGGSQNSATGSHSTVGGGLNNTSSNYWSTVAGGISNNSNGYQATIGGGNDNTSSGYASTVGGGYSNMADGAYSVIPGGLRAKTTRHGELSHSAGSFDENAGNAQHSILIARMSTSDATSNVILTLDGNATSSTNRLTLSAKTSWTFTIKLSAYNDTDNVAAGWIFRGAIRRNASNQTILVGSLIEENWKETAMNNALANVIADDTNDALEIRVTGLSNKEIRWVAIVDISQVSYGTP